MEMMRLMVSPLSSLRDAVIFPLLFFVIINITLLYKYAKVHWSPSAIGKNLPLPQDPTSKPRTKTAQLH